MLFSSSRNAELCMGCHIIPCYFNLRNLYNTKAEIQEANKIFLEYFSLIDSVSNQH